MQEQEKEQSFMSNNANNPNISDKSSTSVSIFTVILIAVIASSAISITASWWLLKKNTREIVVADVSKIIENKKKALIDSYKADSSQENMAKIDRDLLVFLNNLDSILTDHSTGNKIILKKEAIIDGQYEDITEQLESELKGIEDRRRR